MADLTDMTDVTTRYNFINFITLQRCKDHERFISNTNVHHISKISKDKYEFHTLFSLTAFQRLVEWVGTNSRSCIAHRN